jgi:hypothetical protein
MGWVDSPNYLCAITETVADLANARFQANDLSLSAHRLNKLARTLPPTDHDTHTGNFDSAPPPVPHSQGPLAPPLIFTDVYMDDFIAATQLTGTSLDVARSTLFDCINQVLRPL